MKKYLQNRKTLEIECFGCKAKCLKPISEIQRNSDLGRKLFCSRSCSVRYANKKSIGTNRNRHNIAQYSANHLDQFSPIRTYHSIARKRYKDFDLTLEEVLNQWKLQKGICPYTGILMILRNYSKGHKPSLNQASLDRIDSSKGYTKDNIEFVCLGINYLKSNFPKQEVISFLKSFSNFFEDRTISSHITVLDALGSP